METGSPSVSISSPFGGDIRPDGLLHAVTAARRSACRPCVNKFPAAVMQKRPPVIDSRPHRLCGERGIVLAVLCIPLSLAGRALANPMWQPLRSTPFRMPSLCEQVPRGRHAKAAASH